MQVSLLIDQFEMPNQGLLADFSLLAHPRAVRLLRCSGSYRVGSVPGGLLSAIHHPTRPVTSKEKRQLREVTSFYLKL